MKKNLLSIFAIIIAAIAVIIAIIALKIERVGDANYIAIAATLLTGVVAFAVGYNIYMNLSGTRKMAEDVVNTRMSDYISITEKKIQIAQEIMADNVAGTSAHSLGATYYHLKEYDSALKYLNDAKIKFEKCNHPQAIIACNDLISQIEKERKNT